MANEKLVTLNNLQEFKTKNDTLYVPKSRKIAGIDLSADIPSENLFEKIPDETIKPEQTNFFDIDASVNLYNRNSTLNRSSVYIIGSGNYISLSGSSVSHPIKVKPNTTYSFEITPNFYGQNATVVRKCTADGTLLESGFNATSHTTYATFTTDSEVEYVCVNVAVYATMMFVEGSIYPEEYKPYFNPIKTIKLENLPEIPLSKIPAVDPQHTTFFEEVNPTNLYNKNSLLNRDNVYISYNGDYQTLNGSSVSHPIKVEKGKTYCFKWSASWYGVPANKWVRGCDAQGNLNSLDWEATASSDNSYGYFTIGANSTVEYVCVNVRMNDKSVMIFAEGNELPGYTPYFDTKYLVKEENLPQSGEENPLYGKKLAVIGDSICYGAGYVGGYAKIIGEKNNMQVSNTAVSGATITSGDSSRFRICSNITNMPSGYDYYIFEGGVNDIALSVAIGSITNDYTSALDTTTIVGAMESICKLLQTTFMGKKYGFIFPHNVYDYNSAWTNTWRPAMKEVLKKWGIPYLDLSDLCVQLRNIDSLRIYTYNNDGWHPTEDGYRLFYAPKIEAWLKTL